MDAWLTTRDDWVHPSIIWDMIHSKFIHHSHDLCGAHFFDLQVLKESKRAHQSSQSMPNLPNFKKDETLTSFKLSKLSKKTSTSFQWKWATNGNDCHRNQNHSSHVKGAPPIDLSNFSHCTACNQGLAWTELRNYSTHVHASATASASVCHVSVKPISTHCITNK